MKCAQTSTINYQLSTINYQLSTNHINAQNKRMSVKITELLELYKNRIVKNTSRTINVFIQFLIPS